MVEVDDPVYGLMTQPGPMVWLEESAQAMVHPKARRAVSFEQALKTLSAIETKLPRVRQKNARDGWLDGVRILDLCNVIAGPHSVAYLARFGAKVIKLDPAKPFYDCWNTVIFGMSHMRGKRSMLTDMTQPEGRAILEELVRNSDVIVWNAADRQVQSMGLDAESLKKLNPDAIFCKLDCFSGPLPGPRSGYLGYDDLVQATTGIMTRFGGSMDTPEEHAHVGTIDVMCGFGGSLGIAAALYQKLKTGRTGRPRTSLSALSNLAQIPFCYDYARRGLFDEPAGREVAGYDALSRFYYTSSDRFVLLSAYEIDLPRLDLVPGLEGVSKVPAEARAAFLAQAFMAARAVDWVERLQAADIGAAICENIESIRAYNTRPADGTPGTDRGSYAFSEFADHPSGHSVTQLDPFAVRPRRGKIYALDPAEKYGASTRLVLKELGKSDDEVDALVQAGVVSESWSSQYLPD
jgi:crotonobetainyl-CoA:carnitine CoA-transferase CaiB-like acyl-CoA transferase